MAKQKLKVTRTRSLVGKPKTQRAVVRGLGLTRRGKSVIVDNTPAFRGMIKKVIHLVEVEKADV
jgi:large subunit ribosomal protein L30